MIALSDTYNKQAFNQSTNITAPYNNRRNNNNNEKSTSQTIRKDCGYTTCPGQRRSSSEVTLLTIAFNKSKSQRQVGD